MKDSRNSSIRIVDIFKGLFIELLMILIYKVT